MLLDAAHVDFPDEAMRADVSGRSLHSVMRQDMEYFRSLQFLDASENQLSLEDFTCLASLEELRLSCCMLASVPTLPSGSFPCLTVLDLSYNSVDSATIPRLAAIPRLRQLDLSGTGLTGLPSDMVRLWWRSRRHLLKPPYSPPLHPTCAPAVHAAARGGAAAGE